MADVKTHIDLIDEQVRLMQVTAKLMLAADRSEGLELGSHGVLLLQTFAGMLNSMATRIRDNAIDLDMAISIKGHKDK